MFAITVNGVPVPQGSKSATVRGGRAVMFDANSKLRGWRQTVTLAVRNKMAETRFMPFAPDDAIQVIVKFYFERPKSSKRQHMTVKPDVDKLSRSILDSLADAGMFPGDQQVDYLIAEKIYCAPYEKPGVFIFITKR